MRRRDAAQCPLTDDGSRMVLPLAVVAGAVPNWRKEGEGRERKGGKQSRVVSKRVRACAHCVLQERDRARDACDRGRTPRLTKGALRARQGLEGYGAELARCARGQAGSRSPLRPSRGLRRGSGASSGRWRRSAGSAARASRTCAQSRHRRKPGKNFVVRRASRRRRAVDATRAPDSQCDRKAAARNSSSCRRERRSAH